jgi:hypothetical protein
VFPLTCSACGGISYAPGSAGSAVLVVNALLLTCGGFLALYWHSWLPFVLCVAVGFALWLLRLHRQALFKLTPEQVARERTAQGLGVVLVLFFSAMQ